MFHKIKNTIYPPTQTTLIWDGTCGFCKWWKSRWEYKTRDQIRFVPYQDTAMDYPDIPLLEFKKASRLIEPGGTVYSGPDSAFRIFFYAGNKKWHQWYKKHPWFEAICDGLYNHIAKNRNFYFNLTKFLFGKEPHQPKLYWLYYLLILCVFIIILFLFL